MTKEEEKEILLKVRRGRNIIKTVNPYKSANKILIAKHFNYKKHNKTHQS